jgi:hypothetical protein
LKSPQIAAVLVWNCSCETRLCAVCMRWSSDHRLVAYASLTPGWPLHDALFDSLITAGIPLFRRPVMAMMPASLVRSVR